MTHNTREVEAMLKEGMCDHYGDPSARIEEIMQLLHRQLQKARQSWLREEIVKLEGMRIKESHIGIGGLYTAQLQMEVNQALQTIIDRYNEELDQPTSPVYDFFTAPEEVQRPVIEEAIKQASGEQSKLTTDLVSIEEPKQTN